MSTALSDSGRTSATMLRAPRLRFLRNTSKTMGDSIFPLSKNIPGPQPTASIPSEDTGDIDVLPAQDKGLSSNLRFPPTAKSELPVAAPSSTAVKIPRLRKPTYVFPNASSRIRQAHKDRYPALKDIFQRNIENCPNLCDYTTHISYELRMCGSSQADAIESILIFCPSGLLKKIKALLTQPHIRSQFEPEIETSTSVHFRLFFWARTIDMLAFHEIAVVIPEEPDSDDSVADAVAEHAPWGLRLLGDNGEQHTATMGCVLQIGGERFGLTTAHTFNIPARAASTPEDHGVDASDSDTDDEDYDMWMEEEDQVSTATRPMASIHGRGRTIQLGKCQVHTAPPFEDTLAWKKEHANLDWALFEMGANGDRLSTYETEIEGLPIVECLPKECTDVLIITHTFPGVPGTLYNIPSYIGGAKGSPAAEVWTVGCLSKENPIRKGDSGSIVVDARSGELYGMVMAANPFGDIHISPLATVLAQVKELFKNEHTCVLKAPRNLTFPTFLPSVQAGSPLENQGAAEKIAGEHAGMVEWDSTVPGFTREESLSRPGTIVTDQPDVGTPERTSLWRQTSSSLAKERTAPETKVEATSPRPRLPLLFNVLGAQAFETIGCDSEAETTKIPARSIYRQKSVPQFSRASTPAPVLTARRTVISKDTVVREAIEKCGYAYEETDLDFYVMKNLTDDDILELIEISEKGVREPTEGDIREIRPELVFRWNDMSSPRTPRSPHPDVTRGNTETKQLSLKLQPKARRRYLLRKEEVLQKSQGRGFMPEGCGAQSLSESQQSIGPSPIHTLTPDQSIIRWHVITATARAVIVLFLISIITIVPIVASSSEALVAIISLVLCGICLILYSRFYNIIEGRSSRSGLGMGGVHLATEMIENTEIREID